MVSINRIIVTHLIHGQHRQIGRYIPVIFRNNHTNSSHLKFLVFITYTHFFIKTKFKQQVAGTGFGDPLLICLLKFTLNEKSLAHSLQFGTKYHVYSDSLWAQITEHTDYNYMMAVLYYVGEELENL